MPKHAAGKMNRLSSNDRSLSTNTLSFRPRSAVKKPKRFPLTSHLPTSDQSPNGIKLGHIHERAIEAANPLPIKSITRADKALQPHQEDHSTSATGRDTPNTHPKGDIITAADWDGQLTLFLTIPHTHPNWISTALCASPLPLGLIRTTPSGEQIWAIESLIDSRRYRPAPSASSSPSGRTTGRLQWGFEYKVLWEGCDDFAATWEPLANVLEAGWEGAEELMVEFHARWPRKPRPRLVDLGGLGEGPWERRK